MAVKARSLSVLNSWAADPPAIPTDGIDGMLEPVTLYLVRVPGSLDVFLSMMKPREKVVTAEDVQNSLYYCHLDVDEDEAVRKGLLADTAAQVEAARLTDNTVSGWMGPVVQRKPLPSIPQPSPPLSPPKVYPYLQAAYMVQQAKPTMERKPVPRVDVGYGRPEPESARTQKLYGPRAMHSRCLSVLPPTLNDMEADDDFRARRWSEQPQSTSNSSASQERKPALPPRSQDMTLTLIRRDPSTGGQWNVGKITIPRVWAGLDPRVQLEITTDGYEKFSNHKTHDSNEVLGFSRILEKQGPFHDPGSVPLESSGSRRKPLSRQSTFPTNGFSTFKSYAFRSPWNGLCQFSANATGKNLLCKNSSATVSELRFNLPNRPGKRVYSPKKLSDMRSSPKRLSKLMDHIRIDKETSPTLPPREGEALQDGSDDEYDEGPMDLSLGQERAGGGFSGKQAKLGKLIVQNEGLQMLDLIVAANMGMWWRIYGK